MNGDLGRPHSDQDGQPVHKKARIGIPEPAIHEEIEWSNVDDDIPVIDMDGFNLPGVSSEPSSLGHFDDTDDKADLIPVLPSPQISPRADFDLEVPLDLLDSASGSGLSASSPALHAHASSFYPSYALMPSSSFTLSNGLESKASSSLQGKVDIDLTDDILDLDGFNTANDPSLDGIVIDDITLPSKGGINLDLTEGSDEESEDDAQPEEPGDQRIGTLVASLVGMSLFKNPVKENDYLFIERFPSPHDPNAVSVRHRDGSQVGFLEPKAAAAIAPFMNMKMIRTETQCCDMKDPSKPGLRIHISAHESKKLEVDRNLRFYPGILYVPIDQAGGAAGSYSSQFQAGPALSDIESDLDKLFKTEIDFSTLKEREPPRALLTPMYPYQKQGLEWMSQREDKRTMLDGETDNQFFFWEKKVDEDGNVTYLNLATNKIVTEPPEQARGGILADEMGLGKTLQIIALISSTSTKTVAMQPRIAESSSLITLDRNNRPYVPPTLIVCPLSVMSNWQHQVESHVVENHLRICVYHGPQREKDIRKLKSYDVILTTYNILASEYIDPEEEEKKRNKRRGKAAASSVSDSPTSSPSLVVENDSPLFRIKFFRVILDEAHCIRDTKTRQSRAALALNCERRWALTGTPFQNRVGDAFALLAFLRVQPFTSLQWWNRIIVRPLKNRDPKGLERLQMVLGSICLRRRKCEKINGEPILRLPRKVQHVRLVMLQGAEKRLYDTLAISGKSQFRNLLENNSLLRNYAFVLEILLRMRQACDHPKLVPSHYHQVGFNASSKLDEVRRLLLLLEEMLTDDCAACHRQADEPCITTCVHFFCKGCIDRILRETKMCPICQTPLNNSQIITQQHGAMLKQEEEKYAAILDQNPRVSGEELYSSKLICLMEELRRIRGEDPDWKAVVFSQWTSFLNLIQEALVRENIGFVRLDGAMSAQARTKAITTFRDKPSCRIFLISLKAGGVGLNLTSANRVFLMDPWWNPATEDQAVDRVHRLGQTKEVEVIRFIAKDTVEEKIQELQNKKRQMMTTALEGFGKSRKDLAQERLQDLVALFK